MWCEIYTASNKKIIILMHMRFVGIFCWEQYG